MIDRTATDVAYDLFSGETLLWSGKPRSGILLRTRDWFMIPFGAFFLFGGIAAMASFLMIPMDSPPDAQQPPTWLAFFFPLPFLLVGSYFAFVHLLWERSIRNRSTYALTDRRAIIVQNRMHRTVRSISLKDLNDVALTVGRDGVGTITFNESTNPSTLFLQFGVWGYPTAPAFELVEGASALYKTIEDARSRFRER